MDGNRSYYGGGGGGARGRGGGGRRNNYRGGGGGGGRGRGYRHSPYNSNSNSNSNNNNNNNNRPGGGGRGRSSNRFGHNQQQQDPQATLKKQIASFVSRVGELQNLRTPAPEETVTSMSTSASAFASTLRTVEYTTASNINDLVPILLAPDKIELLLKYSPDASQVADKVGHLVHLVVSCAADLPLQTPCYAALTLALDVSLNNNTNNNNNSNNIDDSSSPRSSPYQGFGTRCLQYTMLQIAKELDTTLLTHCTQSAAGATCRLKLLLRYLCLLAQLGMVQAYDVDSVAAATATAGAGATTTTTASVDPNRMTVFGLLSVLVDAAMAATDQFQAPAASQWLALLVLSTLPYVLEWTNVPRDIVDDKLRRPLETLLANYRSTFVPGTGKTALLLKEPQVEEGDEDDDDDDDDDDEEEEEDDSAGQVCDSLQDLLRATKYWRVEGQASRFALPVDAPWKGLLMAPSPPPSEGGANPTTTTTPVVQQPIEYTGAPLYLAFPQECQLLNLLLGGAGSGSPLKIQYFSLEGAVFGRLPIFGSPPNPEDDDDDDDEEEDMDDVAAAAKNEQLQAFQAMSLLDRYFVAETLRDVLLSHESHVTPTGLQMGSAKAAAEELLRVGHVFSNDESSTTVDPSKGMEYAILETILALLAQSTEYSTVRHSYLSRVLLELTRLEPSRLSQALAVAMTNLFQDYLPALVPAARENYSRWFAFHLVNTDYQWPSAFWQLWQPYATSEQASSRGAFVRRAIQYMAENVCDPTPIAQQCFGAGDSSQALVREILGRNAVTLEEPGAEAVLSELRRRLWDSPEDSVLVLEYVTGEEMATALGGAVPWARTDILLRVLMDPARELEQDVKAALEKATAVAIEGDAGEDGMEAEETAFSKDVHVAITDCMTRYKSTIAGALEKDAEGADDKDAALVQGAAFLLRRVESMTSFNQGLMESIVAYLVQERIVPELAVLRWVLRQVGDSVLAPVSSSWSRFATVAVREGLIFLTSEATAGSIMVLDGAATDSEAELATKLTAKVAEILQYVIQRVCGLLTTTQADDKKLKPLHVELLEGTKGLVVHSKHLLISTLTRPTGLRKGMSASDVEDGLSKSEIAGSSLAALCTGEESSMAVKLLKTSLENI